MAKLVKSGVVGKWSREEVRKGVTAAEGRSGALHPHLKRLRTAFKPP